MCTKGTPFQLSSFAILFVLMQLLVVFSHSINVNVLLTLNFAGFTEPHRDDVVEMHSPVALNVN